MISSNTRGVKGSSNKNWCTNSETESITVRYGAIGCTRGRDTGEHFVPCHSLLENKLSPHRDQRLVCQGHEEDTHGRQNSAMGILCLPLIASSRVAPLLVNLRIWMYFECTQSFKDSIIFKNVQLDAAIEDPWAEEEHEARLIACRKALRHVHHRTVYTVPLLPGPRDNLEHQQFLQFDDVSGVYACVCVCVYVLGNEGCT